MHKIVLTKTFKTISTTGNLCRNTVSYIANPERFDTPIFHIEQLFLTDTVDDDVRLIRKFWSKYLVIRSIGVKELTLFTMIGIVNDVYDYLKENNINQE